MSILCWSRKKKSTPPRKSRASHNERTPQLRQERYNDKDATGFTAQDAQPKTCRLFFPEEYPAIQDRRLSSVARFTLFLQADTASFTDKKLLQNQACTSSKGGILPSAIRLVFRKGIILQRFFRQPLQTQCRSFFHCPGYTAVIPCLQTQHTLPRVNKEGQKAARPCPVSCSIKPHFRTSQAEKRMSLEITCPYSLRRIIHAPPLSAFSPPCHASHLFNRLLGSGANPLYCDSSPRILPNAARSL